MAKIATPKKLDWEIRDRTYILKDGTPLSYHIKSRGIIWFDEETGINREVRYATNQNSLFVDEQDKHAKLDHIVFRDGVLFVPRNKPLLQQLLEVYHPHKAKWTVVDKAKEAVSEVNIIETQLEAMDLVRELDIDHLEAIMRAELGSSVNKMSSKEIKRDAYKLAHGNPRLFLELANDDEIQLRNTANIAVEQGIIKLTDNNTKFKWAANGREIMTVPFDAHPYTALSQFFLTDEGSDVLKSIEKKLEK